MTFNGIIIFTLPGLRLCRRIVSILAGLVLSLSVHAEATSCTEHYQTISAKHEKLVTSMPPGTDIFLIKMHELESSLFKALDQCKGDALLFTLMAENLIGTNNVALATIYAKKAYQKKPNAWQTNHVYGKTLCLQKDFKQGIPLLNKAVELKPQRPGLQYNLCQAFLNSEQYEQAVKTCSKVIDMKQSTFTGPAYLIRSLAYKANNQPALAIKDKEKAAELGYK